MCGCDSSLDVVVMGTLFKNAGDRNVNHKMHSEEMLSDLHGVHFR